MTWWECHTVRSRRSFDWCARRNSATTESKVVEVALESGYQSLSLFNLMFKRHFGLTPAKWRSQSTRVKRHGRVALRVRFS